MSIVLATLAEWFCGAPEPEKPYPSHRNLPPPPEPAPSCFALGIARSIRETPDKWIATTLMRLGTVIEAYHIDPYVRLAVWTETQAAIWRVGIDNRDLAPEDERVIIEAVREQPIAQWKDRLDRSRREREKHEATTTHFARLGCAETPSP